VSGGQIVALIFAILLLLPGGCFLLLGTTILGESGTSSDTGFAALLFIVAGVILSFVAFLFWIAFRGRPPPSPPPPQA
jgi:hypothetical protein